MVLSAVRVSSRTKVPTASVIIVHGLGDSGDGWKFLADLARGSNEFDHINFVFPNAPTIPITANQGYEMPGWFDLYQFGTSGGRKDVDGYLKSLKVLNSYVKEQIDLGVKPERIIIGGFSQGAALALGALATFDFKVAGFLIFSGFMPVGDKVKELFNPANIETPVFQGHGDIDPIINKSYADETHQFFKDLGYKNYNYNIYPNLPHSVANEELSHAFDFLKKTIPRE
ncbi:Acyl-protein thioesterase 1 [Wickerhamomyces ciferrii]|uniref:Acyl-protein thioesterase 1 n=1 Tax=Wickerhamomyces ciferrii (strain ATCC 14091 / BCRC 22168 / CBS 111 / JCM 3599 / NBRC 0793 / NRRL Y-1031 F-60-10) TaxID=1206466 RepID=K0KPV0_WICCF|nr:Acyl-protein thioesterase 1 [Wickerhamomyces ciferrii]CCH45046.1 Acyl-protein thioesterase 1 [Wickerhamomyces ciferrii]